MRSEALPGSTNLSKVLLQGGDLFDQGGHRWPIVLHAGILRLAWILKAFRKSRALPKRVVPFPMPCVAI
jgi:hypothetical protein